VSHFVYLATHVEEGRPMSLLELELQAEVDKFAVLLLRIWGRRRGRRARASAALRRRLFERVRYLDHLDRDELNRYRTANRLAAGYARWLERRFVDPGDRDGLLRELRATYRLGTRAKAGYLASRG
jgi:MoxR-like ATPase